jgi:hypothetical protein
MRSWKAWDRGPAWREAIETSLRQLDARQHEVIRSGIRQGIEALGHTPSDYDG